MKRNKLSKIWYTTSDDEFKSLVNTVSTWTELASKCGITSKGCNNKTLKKRVTSLSLDVSHFTARHHNMMDYNIHRTIPLEQVLVANSSYARKNLKKRLINDNVLINQCAVCTSPPIWNGRDLTLVLDHINGISTDNRLENLRLVCPNCNSQLDTHCGRNNKKPDPKCPLCDKPIARSSMHCVTCSNQIKANLRRKVERPSHDQLRTDLLTMSYCAVGKKYGVSDYF